ncbi:MAG: signal peptide peptidase SppA [Bdellovibrionota bacterium]
MSNENKGGRRCGVLAIALSTIGVVSILFVVLFSVFVAFAMHSVSSSVKSLVSSQVPSKSYGTKVNYAVPRKNTPYIAGIKLMGEISGDTADEILDKFKTAKEDSMAVGVLFEVSSPGGSVVPSQEIYDQIKSLQESKPVVVYVREMAASGAYYSSASASKIIANRGSIIGSIGVIMEGFEADKLIQFLKINPVTIKTGALKDTGSPTRAMNETDKKYLQGLIEETREEFVNDVKSARKTTAEDMNFMSDGRVVLAPQALKLKLIDAIGTRDDALSEIAKLAKQKKTPELFYYENIDTFSEIFSQKFSGQVADMLKTSVSQFITTSRLDRGMH